MHHYHWHSDLRLKIRWCRRQIAPVSARRYFVETFAGFRYLWWSKIYLPAGILLAAQMRLRSPKSSTELASYVSCAKVLDCWIQSSRWPFWPWGKKSACYHCHPAKQSISYDLPHFFPSYSGAMADFSRAVLPDVEHRRSSDFESSVHWYHWFAATANAISKCTPPAFAVFSRSSNAIA